MHDMLPTVLLAAPIFFLAGFVKGVIGLGLPTVAVGLLVLFMSPAEAAALLIAPSIVTSVWQMLVGGQFRPSLRRLWPIMMGIIVGTAAGANFMTSGNANAAVAALGLALMIYAGLGLGSVRFKISSHAEIWLAPLVGIGTGLVTAGTGVFAIPAVPYLQALGLPRDQLVQALGLSFTVSTFALAAILTRGGAFHLAAAGASVLQIAPALVGMVAGQWLRGRVKPAVFQFCFFLGLLTNPGRSPCAARALLSLNRRWRRRRRLAIRPSKVPFIPSSARHASRRRRRRLRRSTQNKA